MTSPTTAVGCPGRVLPSIDEVTVVLLQGCSALVGLPISSAGAWNVPLVGGDQSGKRMPLVGAWASAREAITNAAPAPTRESFFAVLDMADSCCQAQRTMSRPWRCSTPGAGRQGSNRPAL